MIDQVNHRLVVNIHVEEYDIYIGRKRHGMHYGNPFSYLPDSLASVIVGSKDACVQSFGEWLDKTAWLSVEPERRQWVLDHISELRGKRLGCFCAPNFCHGTPLAIRANT